MIRTSLTLLCALTLVACQAAPTTAPTGGHASLTITPSIARRLASTLAPNTIESISHLEIRLKRGDTAIASADVPSGKLANPIGFSNLLPNTTYVVSAIAYDANGNVISDPDLSTIPVTLTNDDAPTLLTLPVKLLDKSFSGSGQAPGLVITRGGFATSGAAVIMSGGTYASANSAGYQDSLATGAQYQGLYGIAQDNAGNIYLTDQGNQCIRMITVAGISVTIAGGTNETLNGYGYQDGPGAQARFGSPSGIAIDRDGGYLYVVDYGNSAIRRIDLNDPAYTVSAAAGVGTNGYPNGGSADGPATQAGFRNPQGIAYDGSGHLYVADYYNQTIRQIDLTSADKTVTTIAGRADSNGYANGAAADARFSYPQGIAANGDGYVYVADNNQVIRRIDLAAQTVTALVGGTDAQASGAGRVDGTADVARLNYPRTLALDDAGHLFVGEDGGVRRIDLTLPGTPVTSLTGGVRYAWGYADGPGANASIAIPMAISVASGGRLLVADYGHSTVRRIDYLEVGYPVSTLAGGDGVTPNGTGYRHGTSFGTRFQAPTGVTVDASGRALVADTGNHVIRSVSKLGIAATLAGTAQTAGYANGPASSARFSSPEGTAVDAAGNLYVADTGNHAIRKITPAGVVSTIAGGDATTAGGAGYANGAGATARFSGPTDLLVLEGQLYVSDAGNHAVRRIDLESDAFPVTTVAGGADAANGPGYSDGSGDVAQLTSPHGLAFEPVQSRLYVADTGNHLIRSIDLKTSSHSVRTVAGATDGVANGAGYADGVGASARFSAPRGLLFDATGNLYVADSGNHAIRKIAPLAAGNLVTTLSGGDGTTANGAGYANGAGPSARFSSPVGLAFTGNGSLIILVDSGNHVLRILN